MNGEGEYRFASGRVYKGVFENGIIVRNIGEEETEEPEDVQS